MWFCYGIQQTDKTSLGTQAIFGLREDTNLVGQQYSWLTTIFYITYLCGEFPSNFLLQRWSLGKSLSIYMFCWGKTIPRAVNPQTPLILMSLRRCRYLHWRRSELVSPHGTPRAPRFLRMHHQSRLRSRHWIVVPDGRTLRSSIVLPKRQCWIRCHWKPFHVRDWCSCRKVRRSCCVAMHFAVLGLLHSRAVRHLLWTSWKSQGGEVAYEGGEGDRVSSVGTIIPMH